MQNTDKCFKQEYNLDLTCVFWEQDHTEHLGYVLGLLSFAINWTAKFPFILKAVGGNFFCSSK